MIRSIWAAYTGIFSSSKFKWKGRFWQSAYWSPLGVLFRVYMCRLKVFAFPPLTDTATPLLNTNGLKLTCTRSAAERRPIMLALAALTGWKPAWGSTRLVRERRTLIFRWWGVFNFPNWDCLNNNYAKGPLRLKVVQVSGAEYLHITGAGAGRPGGPATASGKRAGVTEWVTQHAARGRLARRLCAAKTKERKKKRRKFLWIIMD